MQLINNLLLSFSMVSSLAIPYLFFIIPYLFMSLMALLETNYYSVKNKELNVILEEVKDKRKRKEEIANIINTNEYQVYLEENSPFEKIKSIINEAKQEKKISLIIVRIIIDLAHFVTDEAKNKYYPLINKLGKKDFVKMELWIFQIIAMLEGTRFFLYGTPEISIFYTNQLIFSIGLTSCISAFSMYKLTNERKNIYDQYKFWIKITVFVFFLFTIIIGYNSAFTVDVTKLSYVKIYLTLAPYIGIVSMAIYLIKLHHQCGQSEKVDDLTAQFVGNQENY